MIFRLGTRPQEEQVLAADAGQALLQQEQDLQPHPRRPEVPLPQIGALLAGLARSTWPEGYSRRQTLPATTGEVVSHLAIGPVVRPANAEDLSAQLARPVTWGAGHR